MPKTLLIISLIFLAFVFISNHSSIRVQAELFPQNCGGSDVRPACIPIPTENFTPEAYSQVPVKDDCSNYCFSGHEVSFTAEPIINQTSITCGEPISAKYSKVGDFLNLPDYEDPVRIDGESGVGIAGITSLSLSSSDRPNTDTWWRLINELGSVYTNLRGSPLSQFTQLDYGKNIMTLSYKQQLLDRLDYCERQLACLTDNYADGEDITDQRPPRHRCVNLMPYDMYPEDPDRNDLVHEKDVCERAMGDLTPLKNDPAKSIADYFTPCNLAPEGRCNPNYYQKETQDFIHAYHALEPASKARELMVICTDYVDVREQEGDALIDKYTNLGDVSQGFDCQEVLTPPGLIAACQGLTRQYQATTAYKYSSTLHDRLEAELKGMGQLTGEINDLTQGPIVKLEPDWWGAITGTRKRLATYAQRINIEGNTCLSVDNQRETYGDANAEDMDSSDPNVFSSDSTINNSNASSGEIKNAKRTFIISTPAFQQCLDRLAFTDDQSLSKNEVAFDNYNNETAYRAIPLQHSQSISSPPPSANICFASINDDGNWIPSNQVPPGVTPKAEQCYHWEELHQAESGENAISTNGGSTPLNKFLYNFKQHFTSFFSEDYAGGIVCDWFAYTHNLPIPPGCGSRTAGGGGSGAGSYCSEGSESSACAVSNFLPYFGSLENATIASRACRRESGGYTGALNSSCLSGGTDFSVGMFQINLWATGRCEARGFSPWAHTIEEQKERFNARQSCVVGNRQALIGCIASYGGDPQKFDSSAPAPEENYFFKNIEWAAQRACGYPNVRAECDWGPWKANPGSCQITDYD